MFRKLLKWYDKHGRDLPWRRTRDAYRILVSEIMLQQTQVSRVIDFYQRWLVTFPDWHALAMASNADVIKAWSGLGYNRRALALRDIAKQVLENGVPQSREEWLALKGIGPYTSSALATFSLHQPSLPIDTNIRRVLGRVQFGTTYPQPKDDDRLRGRVENSWAGQQRIPDLPQALFDLATMICGKIPDCRRCPLQADCAAAPKFLSGKVRVPQAMVKKAKETKHRDKPYPDRIYRGRIVSLLQEQGSGISLVKLGKAIDSSFVSVSDKTWLKAMVLRLERDGLVRLIGDSVFFV